MRICAKSYDGLKFGESLSSLGTVKSSAICPFVQYNQTTSPNFEAKLQLRRHLPSSPPQSFAMLDQLSPQNAALSLVLLPCKRCSLRRRDNTAPKAHQAPKSLFSGLSANSATRARTRRHLVFKPPQSRHFSPVPTKSRIFPALCRVWCQHTAMIGLPRCYRSNMQDPRRRGHQIIKQKSARTAAKAIQLCGLFADQTVVLTGDLAAWRFRSGCLCLSAAALS